MKQMRLNQWITALIFGGLCSGSKLQAGSITEPPTTFYGKVLGIGGAQPFVLQDGELEWTILRSDGSEWSTDTSLFPLNKGLYSYEIQLPHTATGATLEPGSGIPMPPIASTNEHARVTINGLPAQFAGPSGAFFEIGQQQRAATYRLDLIVDIAPLDSDHDGLPDWWEELYGLNKENAADAGTDIDGDGLTNRDEYISGFDPLVDNRLPGLLTTELLAYEKSATGLRLIPADSDSAASNVSYTVTQPPIFGKLILRNQYKDPAQPDQELVSGDSFTQQDVEDGKLVFLQQGDFGTTNQTAFSLLVADENAAHTPTNTTLAVQFYQPPEADIHLSPIDALRKQAHRIGSSSNTILWDALSELTSVALQAPSTGLTATNYATSYRPFYGDEKAYYLLGGYGDDVLQGGMADDTLFGRRGMDRLSGGGGSDRFVFGLDDRGTDLITDFSPAEGDVLDLSALLAGCNGRVNNFLQFEPRTNDTLLHIGLEGNGITFTNLHITLQDLLIDDELGYDLLVSGAVQVGALKLPSKVAVVATDAVASENGGNSARFTLSRQGDWSQPLTVAFTLGGSAVNGTDFSTLALTAQFAAGQQQVDVTVQPFADSQIEPDESVELVLSPSEAYLVSASNRATVVIKDLQSVVSIEVVEERATLNPLSPALFLLRRNGQTASPLFVQLNLSGPAINGSDYQYVATYASFAAGQTVIPIEIVPLASAELSGGAKVVHLSVQPDSQYALADVAAGRIFMVERRDTLAGWQARTFPDSTASTLDFAQRSTGPAAANHLQQYAFGMDPQNPDATRLPHIVWRNGRMTVDVHRNPEATDVTLQIDISSNLSSWERSAVLVRKIEPAEYADRADIETYEVVPLVETEAHYFMRIEVEYTE